MRRSAENILAVSSIGIAVFLISPAFQAGPLVIDEHAAYWLCDPEGPLSIWERSSRYAAVLPLASWTQAASLTVLGTRELALRLPSMLAYVLAVGVMAFGCRSCIGGLPAAVAACSLALHPDVVDEVRVGRTYGLVVLWTTILLLLTYRHRDAKSGWIGGILWCLIAAAAIWTHILTIPVVAMSAMLLGVADVRRSRSIRGATVIAWLLAGLLCVPLIPMGERIWEWRYALNYQIGNFSLADAVGPYVWLGLPLAGGAALIATWGMRVSSPVIKESSPTVGTAAAIGTAVAMGLVPLLVLVVAGQGDLSSLANPRYRVPFAAANATLLGLLCCRLRRPSLAVACLAISLAASWMAVGRLPTQLVRLNTPQAPVWKQIAEVLEQTVHEQHLENSPVFVQSGLIEGVLIPAYPEDLPFHGYVSSRLGRFYARTPNPRYALPLFWGGDHPEMIQFFDRVLAETAGNTPSDLFVAVATDTDVNRRSYEVFESFLKRYGYQGTLLTGHETWAVLYHYRRPADTTESRPLQGSSIPE